MDGHPEVGAATVTRDDRAAPACRDPDAARPRRAAGPALLALRSLRVAVRDALAASLTRDAEELPDARVLRRPHHEWEPLRTKLGFIERSV